MDKLNIVFASGGTAGHIYPAIAIANEIKKKDANAKILFIGTQYGMEKEFVPNAGFDIEFINIRGFKRSFAPKAIFSNIVNAFRLFTASNKAEKILKKFNANFVVGTGGYVSGPVLRTAHNMGIKTLIHEQNAFPGVTNKLLSKMVDTTCISFKDARKLFPDAKNVIYTGNPIRQDISNNVENAREIFGIENELPVVAVVGGSLGANAINEQILDIIKSGEKRYNILWSTGKRNYDDIIEKVGKAPENIKILPYIDNMPALYSIADLLISRSGAIAVAEIAITGTPSILIPSPNVTSNHQEYNARSLGEGAIVLLEEDIEKTPEMINQTVFAKDKLKDMRENLLKQAKPNATEKIVEIIYEHHNKKIK